MDMLTTISATKTTTAHFHWEARVRTCNTVATGIAATTSVNTLKKMIQPGEKLVETSDW